MLCLKEVNPVFLNNKNCKQEVLELCGQFADILLATDYRRATTMVMEMADEDGYCYKLTTEQNHQDPSRYAIELVKKGTSKKGHGKERYYLAITNDSLVMKKKYPVYEQSYMKEIHDQEITYQMTNTGFVRKVSQIVWHDPQSNVMNVQDIDTVRSTQIYEKRNDSFMEMKRQEILSQFINFQNKITKISEEQRILQRPINNLHYVVVTTGNNQFAKRIEDADFPDYDTLVSQNKTNRPAKIKIKK